MIFKVVDFFPSESDAKPKTVYLSKDGWNDWHKYRTLFSVMVCDAEGTCHSTGSIKIGQKGIVHQAGKEIVSPEVPSKFLSLPEDFFAVGQGEDYYQALLGLSEEERKAIYEGLRDCAYLPNILEDNSGEDIMQESLLRTVHYYTVKERFARIARGNAVLTRYNFKYTFPNEEAELDVTVKPNSSPPTNIHILIGSNGVGKTHCLKNIANSIISTNSSQVDTYGKVSGIECNENFIFSRVLFVSFSAFDIFNFPDEKRPRIPFIQVGLTHAGESGQSEQDDVCEQQFEQKTNASNALPFNKDFLGKRFLYFFKKCCQSKIKRQKLFEAFCTLEQERFFKQSRLAALLDNNTTPDNDIKNTFNSLSSGHSIITLIIVNLVFYIEERSLVLFDEPESHLHPPLLSAFIRSLSNLLNSQNGVAIVATHSPIILQEVPRSCVSKLSKEGDFFKLERPLVETFGETLGELTSEVFGLDLLSTGYVNILEKEVSLKTPHAKNYRDIVDDTFENQLGSEALSILRALLATRDAKAEREE